MENLGRNYSCTNDDCSMTFTSEDNLIAHVKRHEMVLNLGVIKGNLFNDQTPTPTRFIRNCDEVGLFQDLQNVNPFEETFKRAVEQTRNGSTNLTTPLSNILNDDTLHTPHIFPNFSNIGDSVFQIKEQNSNCNSAETEKKNYEESSLSIESNPKRNKIDTQNVLESESKFNKATNELDSVLGINGLKVYERTALTLHVEHDEIEPKGTIETKIITSDGNKVILPVLDQTRINEKQAKQILEKNNKKANGSNSSQKITNIKEHLKASLLKNSKPPEVKTSLPITNAGILTKVQHVSPILITNSYPIISPLGQGNLCRILPKNVYEPEVCIPSKTNTQKNKNKNTVIKQNPQHTQNQEDEQRQEFLARSRAAASRWRVKKKQQIRELAIRNQQLEHENSCLRSECTELKKMLLAHKDCPISQAAAAHNITAISSAIIIPANVQNGATNNSVDLNKIKNTS